MFKLPTMNQRRMRLSSCRCPNIVLGLWSRGGRGASRNKLSQERSPQKGRRGAGQAFLFCSAEQRLRRWNSAARLATDGDDEGDGILLHVPSLAVGMPEVAAAIVASDDGGEVIDRAHRGVDRGEVVREWLRWQPNFALNLTQLRVRVAQLVPN